MRTGTQAALKPAIQTELHRMVDRGGSVSSNQDYARPGIEPRTAQSGESTGSRVDADRNCRAQRPWITVDALEERGALGAHIADSEHRVGVQLTLDFQ